jgi:hypothetical protein
MSLKLEPQVTLPLSYVEQIERLLRAEGLDRRVPALVREADSLRALIRVQYPELAAGED